MRGSERCELVLNGDFRLAYHYRALLPAHQVADTEYGVGNLIIYECPDGVSVRFVMPVMRDYEPRAGMVLEHHNDSGNDSGNAWS